MAIAFALILGSFIPLILQASEPGSLSVRVAVVRNASTLEQTLQALCQHEYQVTIRVIKNNQGRYEAINILDVEDFLLGVIGREMDPRAPLEALKAQAIAARSHALYQANISDNQPYDLIANLSQAYAGKTKLHKNVVIAIEATRGQLLYYANKPLPAYFHESCGGHTETITDIWAPMTAGKSGSKLTSPGSARCPACSQSTEKKWRFELPVATLQRALKQAGFQVGATPSIAILEKTSSSRALKVAIRSETGEILLSAEKLRSLLGYSKLRSAMFDVQRVTSPDGTSVEGKTSPASGGQALGKVDDRLIFQGDGYGHGVGLCQFGARQMAEKGASCDTILAHYFPNCRVRPCALETLASTQPGEKLETGNFCALNFRP